jgi:CubicO group peptidase (beta-lactamase class C family)
MDFELSHDVAERISRIETSLFIPSRVSQLRGELGTLVDRMKQYSIPGVSIAVIHQGRIEWARGYGVADAETQKPVTSDTLFQAASISKPVTAAAVLRLVDAGHLDLDEDVNTYLRSWKVPNTRSWQPRITLRQLLCHGAGVTMHGFPGYTHDAVIPTLGQVLAGEIPANTDPIRVNALPGTQFRYSGGGYCILQQVLMDVTSKPFPELMREIVLDPAGMKKSTFEQPPSQRFADVVATGHRAGGKTVSGKWHVYPEMAAAGLWTTPSDLARFALTIQRTWAGETANFLSQEMVRQMLAPQVEPFAGLGPRLDGEGTSSRFSHTGGNEGFRCVMEAYVQKSLGAVVMTNSDEGFFVIEKTMPAIAQEYGWPNYLPKEAGTLERTHSISDAFLGAYELKPGFTFTVVKEGDRLFLQPTGQNALVLYPEIDTTYVLNEVDAQVTFVREDQEEVTSLLFKQNAREMAAKKMKTRQ